MLAAWQTVVKPCGSTTTLEARFESRQQDQCQRWSWLGAMRHTASQPQVVRPTGWCNSWKGQDRRKSAMVVDSWTVMVEHLAGVVERPPMSLKMRPKQWRTIDALWAEERMDLAKAPDCVPCLVARRAIRDHERQWLWNCHFPKCRWCFLQQLPRLQPQQRSNMSLDCKRPHVHSGDATSLREVAG